MTTNTSIFETLLDPENYKDSSFWHCYFLIAGVHWLQHHNTKIDALFKDGEKKDMYNLSDYNPFKWPYLFYTYTVDPNPNKEANSTPPKPKTENNDSKKNQETTQQGHQNVKSAESNSNTVEKADPKTQETQENKSVLDTKIDCVENRQETLQDPKELEVKADPNPPMPDTKIKADKDTKVTAEQDNQKEATDSQTGEQITEKPITQNLEDIKYLRGFNSVLITTKNDYFTEQRDINEIIADRMLATGKALKDKLLDDNKSKNTVVYAIPHDKDHFKIVRYYDQETESIVNVPEEDENYIIHNTYMNNYTMINYYDSNPINAALSKIINFLEESQEMSDETITEKVKNDHELLFYFEKIATIIREMGKISELKADILADSLRHHFYKTKLNGQNTSTGQGNQNKKENPALDILSAFKDTVCMFALLPFEAVRMVLALICATIATPFYMGYKELEKTEIFKFSFFSQGEEQPQLETSVVEQQNNLTA